MKILLLISLVFGPNGPAAFAGSPAVTNAIEGLNSSMSTAFEKAQTAPNFNSAEVALNTELAKCNTDAGLDSYGAIIASAVETATTAAANRKSKDKTKVSPIVNDENFKSLATSEVCKNSTSMASFLKSKEAACGPLSAPASPNACTSYFKNKSALGEDTTKRQTATENSDSFYKAKDSAACFQTIARWSVEGCSPKGLENFDKQMLAMKCQIDVLAKVEGIAAQAVTAAMQENTTGYASKVALEGEIVAQIVQVDAELGPDPALGSSGSNLASGLLNLQKKINDDVNKFKVEETKQIAAINKLKEDVIQSEQNLDATVMKSVTSCMNGAASISVGSGASAKAMTCITPAPDPVPGPDGKIPPKQAAVEKTCGPKEYYRSQAVNSAYKNGAGYMVDGSRRDEARRKGILYDAQMAPIFKDLGDMDNPLATNNSIDVNIKSYAQFERIHSARLANLSKALNYDVAGDFKKVVKRCFVTGDNFRNQQLRSPESNYRKAVKINNDTRREIETGLLLGIKDLKRNYSDVFAVLTGNPSAQSNFPCPNNNTDAMLACYKNVELGLNDILSENSAVISNKEIKGGNQTPTFKVPCRGLDGCVKVYVELRKSQKNAVRSVAQQRQKWVAEGNGRVQAGISSFAKKLTDIQNKVTNQYSAMVTTLTKAGAGKVKTSLNFMAKAQLAPSEGKVPGIPPSPEYTEQGTWKDPGNGMAEIFSQFVPPNGLIKFDDAGYEEAAEAKKELTDKLAEKKEKAATAADELMASFGKTQDEISTGCNDKYVVGGSSSTVGSVKCVNCDASVRACETALKAGKADYETKLATWQACNATCGAWTIATNATTGIPAAPVSPCACKNSSGATGPAVGLTSTSPSPTPPATNDAGTASFKAILEAVKTYQRSTSTTATTDHTTIENAADALTKLDGANTDCINIKDACTTECDELVKGNNTKAAEVKAAADAAKAD